MVNVWQNALHSIGIGWAGCLAQSSSCPLPCGGGPYLGSGTSAAPNCQARSASIQLLAVIGALLAHVAQGGGF